MLALLFAIVTWLYVSNEINRDPSTDSVRAKVFPSYGKIYSRRLYVKAIFIGEPPPGYELVMSDVKLNPSYFVVAAPASVLNKVDKFETEPIDISRIKKTTVVDARLSPLTPSLKTESLTVKVTVPIRKKEGVE